MDTDQAAIGAVCSGSTLFGSILNSAVMLGNYLQQMTSAVDIFRCNFSWPFNGSVFEWKKQITWVGSSFDTCCIAVFPTKSAYEM